MCFLFSKKEKCSSGTASLVYEKKGMHTFIFHCFALKHLDDDDTCIMEWGGFLSVVAEELC
jgi:hypothetical protein